MQYNAFFPFKSHLDDKSYHIAFAPALRVKHQSQLEELAFAAETFLPRESELTMLLHGGELVVALRADVCPPSEIVQYTRMLTRAAVLNEIFLTPSHQPVCRDLSTLSL